MKRYINCIANQTSEGNLLIGDNYTALFDCGMAFCADATIQNVKNALNGRPGLPSKSLDFIFITHTHYDHIGALPFIRKEWPSVRLVTSEVGAAVLLKNTPRSVIRELSAVAAAKYDAQFDQEYSDDAFHADITVKDGGIVQLGGVSVEVLETPGHTRDSLSFFLPELELLILNETPGVLLPDGNVYPAYLTSYSDAVRSLEKCRQIPYRFLSLPHRGIATDEEAKDFFDKALEADIACRDFILDMTKKNLGEDEMLDLFTQRYGNDMLFSYQPKEAFITNARATIFCTLREFLT
jgi:glyoxylase-like metal-dependent hydrolase (beta-lactamase superfamily II)